MSIASRVKARRENLSLFTRKQCQCHVPVDEHYPATRLCENWTCDAYDGVCSYHLKNDPHAPQFYNLQLLNVGRFRWRNQTETFAAVYHPGVFKCDGPGEMANPRLQYKRAQVFERFFDENGATPQESWDAQKRDEDGSKPRYIIAVMNPGRGRRLGAFFDCPLYVRDVLFLDSVSGDPSTIHTWPGHMDIYVVDPTKPDEMDFLVSIMEEMAQISKLEERAHSWWAVPYRAAVQRAGRRFD